MAWILFGTFIALILLRVPISIAIGTATVLTFLTSDFSTALQIIPQQMLEGVNKASLTAVPFFIMAGNLMNATGVTERIFAFANALVGHLKAGLAQVNILSSMIFAGISGAAVADCAGLGAIEIKAMRENGYKPDFAAAITVASSVIGPLIPPLKIFKKAISPMRLIYGCWASLPIALSMQVMILKNMNMLMR